MFHMHDKKIISVTSHAFYLPLPLSQTVTPFWTPSPSSVTYFMDGPWKIFFKTKVHYKLSSQFNGSRAS